MAGEWIQCTLADACDSINYGLTAAALPDKVRPKLLRITDIVAGHIDWHAVPCVAADDRTLAKYRLNDGDVVLARTGASTGASAFVKNSPPAVFASNLVRSRAKREFDARFLAYYLRSAEFWTFIRGVLGGKSAQPNASASTMTKAPLRAPRDKGEQRAIAHILGTLDDKIELNRRRNTTLEPMARALFKAWFVNFEPVRAKLEGRWQRGQSLACLPAHRYDLFPDRLVDSDLGEIPEGWKLRAIGDIADVVGGSTPRTSEAAYWECGVHCWATRKDLSNLSVPVLLDTERRVTDAGLNQISSGLLPAGAVSLSSRAPIGYLAIAEVPVAINQGFIAMKSREGISNVFLLLWTRSAMDEKLSRANGSTFLEISKSNFRPIALALPPEQTIRAFDDPARPMYHQIVTNERESRTLATLRNTVLPKLMSGGLRVKDAERIADEVTA